MLTHISVNDKDDETSVEELTQEGTLYDCCFLLTDCILTNPRNKEDNNFLKNNVNRNDNDCN